MSEKNLIFKIILILGITCLFWIILDLYLLIIDLEGVIFLNFSGLTVGIGYLLMIMYHILILVVQISGLKITDSKNQSIALFALLIISVFALAVEKVMFDEVGREYYLEYPIPGETYFIYLGIILNLTFILFGTIFAYKRIRSNFIIRK